MRIACLGGGPAGLYFAISMKLRDPAHEVLVLERNRAEDAFGWGVVLSVETLDNLAANDAISADSIRSHFAYWDDIAVHVHGTRTVSTGHGFCGIGRRMLLQILQSRARDLGVDLRFESEVTDPTALMADHDLVVAADGVNSRSRAAFADVFRPDIDVRACKFVWLGTHQKFDDAFTFIFTETPHGWVWAHAYQFDQDTATFIVECAEDTWQALGFDRMTQDESIATCQEIFADHLGGHELLSNVRHPRGSAWINFPRVLCARWSHRNLVLMGDAAATAHFSIGSGTKLALESAVALADYLHAEADMSAAFARYEDERRVEVLRLQSAARNSTEWFEDVERYLHLDPVQLTYSLMTRSQRISHENLRLRDPGWLGDAEAWFQRQAGADESAVDRAPMFAPYRLRDMTLPNRVVVSPMAQYRAVDGCPTDWHLVHYGERAKGGAGLVMTEMTCVSPDGRITPGCAGFYAPEHEVAWRRIVDFVHAESPARIAAQIGHSGAKGATQLGWEEGDAPLPVDRWPLMAASAVPWSARNDVPRAMDRADMDLVRDQFVAATEMALRCGFDMVELHMAHGYLLSSFITPVTNHRTDEYGGTLENRMRFPLEVFGAVRSVWPDARPISVRISANDWVGDVGITPPDAVDVARVLQEAGVDVCNVSAGQTSAAATPVYGRMFQTPFSDRIRNETGMATMAVGNIYEPDHVNSILMAGRADLVCLARPHLADPYWTLHAAATLGDRGVPWPLPYLPGRDQLHRLAERGEMPRDGCLMGALDGRTALVTGGGTGIGAAIARTFARAGATVTIAGRRPDPLAAIADEHDAITAAALDVTDEDAVAALFAERGPFDIVVANAGAADSAPLTRTTLEQWEALLSVNLTGTFLTLREAVRQPDTGWGRLIAVASTAGLVGYPYVAAYCAVKHGTVGLVRALGKEVAGSGRTVNAICPGYTDTPLVERSIDRITDATGLSADAALDGLLRPNPTGRLVHPDEVAAAALWLCGSGSDMVQGQAIAVDGGET